MKAGYAIFLTIVMSLTSMPVWGAEGAGGAKNEAGPPPRKLSCSAKTVRIFP